MVGAEFIVGVGRSALPETTHLKHHGARATNSSIVMQLRGKGELPAVDGFEVDDSGVTAEVENVLSDSEVASAATLLA
jgi:hypothetical protein